MSSFRKFSFKLAFYTVFLLYVIGDLFVWDGFLAGKFRAHFKPMDNPFGDNSEMVASVFGEPITQNQLRRRKAELAFVRGWRAGYDPTSEQKLTAQQEKTLNALAMHGLIDESLLRLKTRTNDMRLPDVSYQAKDQMEKFKARFPLGYEDFMKALSVQKLTEKDLCDKMAARLKERAMMARTIDEAVPVNEQELRFFYDRVKDKIRVPEQRQLKHIFMATLHKNPEAVRHEMEGVLGQLRNGKSFEALAKQYSEDSKTASHGGQLGRVTKDRANLLQGVDLFALPTNTPVLVQSKLGWHLFVASSIEPARQLSFDEAKPALISALDSLRRERAVDLYAEDIRQDAHQKKRILFR
jgi:parvulin-like peptidyl-prolyl isomerase